MSKEYENATWSLSRSQKFWKEYLEAQENDDIECENEYNDYGLVKLDVLGLVGMALQSQPKWYEQNLTSLDYGSWSGKWTRDLVDISSKLISVDMYKKSGDFIEERHGKYADENNCLLEYYITNGDELKGIKDSTVDFIFSMDSIVRAPRQVLSSLAKEFYRCLTPGGTCLINIHQKIWIEGQSEFKNLNWNWHVLPIKASTINPYTRMSGPSGTESCFLIIKKRR